MLKQQCQIIDGKFYAANILQQLKEKVILLKKEYFITPSLAVILVGEDEASLIYTNNKIKKAKEIGIVSHNYRLREDIIEAELISLIKKLNADTNVNGILVQLPLPKHINVWNILNLIDPKKDVDGFNTYNIGLLNSWQHCLEPCTPQGILILLKAILGENLSGKKAVILGRSLIVGRPMSAILLRENCTVTVMHSYSKNQADESKTADILISAVGNPHIIKEKYVKKGTFVVDVGIKKVHDKVYGDVDLESVSKVAGFATPVPGGVGPMTIACLMSNTIKATFLQNNLNFLNENL